MSSKKSNYSFTFKDYFRFLKTHLLLIVIFALIGAIGSIIYANAQGITYSATAKVIIHNAETDQGSAFSPYAQFKEVFMSDKILEEKVGISDASTHIDVRELTRGVFVITDTELNAEEAIDNVKKISDNIEPIIREVYSDYEKYEISILSFDDEATPSTSIKKNILMCVVATIAMAILAAIILFIKFDFTVEE